MELSELVTTSRTKLTMTLAGAALLQSRSANARMRTSAPIDRCRGKITTIDAAIEQLQPSCHCEECSRERDR